MSKKFIINSLEELQTLVDYIKMEYWSEEKIFMLNGDLGLGKTQFVKFILKDVNVYSPTFNTLNIYKDIYWHFDLYMKEKVFQWQLEELGWYDFLMDDRAKCFIEWAEKLDFYISGIKLHFLYENNDRVVFISKV